LQQRGQKKKTLGVVVSCVITVDYGGDVEV